MNVDRFLLEAPRSFGPETVAAMSRAYADAANSLGIVESVDGPGSRKEAIARFIVELAKLGERDPYQLSRLAIKRMNELKGLQREHRRGIDAC